MLLNACILHVEHAKVGESNYDHYLPVLFCFFLCPCVPSNLTLYVRDNKYHPLLMWLREKEKKRGRGVEGRERERERERERARQRRARG